MAYTSELPGYEFAIGKGYALHSYSGNKHSACYVKDGVFLKVRRDMVDNHLYAEISTHIGLITCTSGELSFPHPKFERFESQIERLSMMEV